jgi:DNA-binding CsgD family transcriptional regulator
METDAIRTVGVCAASPHAALIPYVPIPLEDRESWLRILVQKVKDGDRLAETALRQTFERGVRYVAAHGIAPQWTESVVSKTFLAFFEAIREDRINAPAAVVAFVWTAVHQQLTFRNGKNELVSSAVHEMRPRDRDILERLYCQGQSPQLICSELKLSESRLRQLKSRAKEHLGLGEGTKAILRPLSIPIDSGWSQRV